MATKKELERDLAILLGGRAYGIYKEAGTLGGHALRGERLRETGMILGRGAKFGGRQLITKNPWGLAALLVYEGYIHRDEIGDVARSLGGEVMDRRAGMAVQEQLGERFPAGPGIKRIASKANKAMKKAAAAVKKAYPKQDNRKRFQRATKIASKANPVTKSRIGKGKSFAQRTARKIRKSIWGTLRRKK